MNCRKCAITCLGDFSINKNFCADCKCSSISHYVPHSNDNLFDNLTEQLCDINKNLFKLFEETSRLAKKFGLSWLPIGIQPSEVDRFLKYFPAQSYERKSMFIKSNFRSMEIEFQFPFHDRCRNNMIYNIGNKTIDRCDKFFLKRRETNIDVGRLDHLDKSEGKTCNDCMEIISFGEMCAMLPKLFQQNLFVWHPNCFKCITCKHLLIDYLFCWDLRDDSGPYCLRHFDDRYFPRCVVCNELIFDDDYATVLDDNFHTTHLKCHSCDKSLEDDQFVLDFDDSLNVKALKCITCLNTPNFDDCFICKKKTNDPLHSVLRIDGFAVHEACVCCHLCRQPLSISDPDSYIKEDKARIFCLNCDMIRKLAECHKCKKTIDLSDASNVIHGKFVWHKNCLECLMCKKIVSDGDKFTVVNENGKISRVHDLNLENAAPVCSECFLKKHEDVCEICVKRIDKEGVRYQSRLFHKSCFQCHSCLSDLDPSKFTTKDNKFYCVRCYSNIFCNTCFSCNLAIFGTENINTMVNFETRYWHGECFNCYSCSKPLFESGFLFADDKISCTDCGNK